jgi:phosphatidylcholine synthase
VKLISKAPAVALAWTAHAYTATGAVLAFFGLEAAIAADFRQAFWWMLAATLVDGTDGLLARAARVRERTPGVDGARLDDIVDYVTFVFLPAVVMFRAGLLPEGWGSAVVAAVLLSSAYGFARTDAKTDDYFFTGFPSYWNVVALYLYAGGLPATANAGIVLFLSLMVFVRIGYVYPSRTPVLRTLTLALCAVWAGMVVAIVARLPEAPPVLVAASLFFPVYYTALSLALHARRRRPT